MLARRARPTGSSLLRLLSGLAATAAATAANHLLGPGFDTPSLGDRLGFLAESPFDHDPNDFLPQLGRRLELDVIELENNGPSRLNLNSGQHAFYSILNRTIWGPAGEQNTDLPSDIDANARTSLDRRAPAEQPPTVKEETTRYVHIAINVCQQPTQKIKSGKSPTKGPPREVEIPSQLRMFISMDSQDQNPGPSSNTSTDNIREVFLRNGFASVNVTANSKSTAGIYIGIHAPNITSDFEGLWNYELAASVDSPYYSYSSSPFISLLDTDSTSAMFITDGLTLPDAPDDIKDKWMHTPSPFTLRVYPEVEGRESTTPGYSDVSGLEASVCGLASTQDAPSRVLITPVNNFPDGSIRYRFHAQGLEPGKVYAAVPTFKKSRVAKSIAGGGRTWRPVRFMTKSDRNCAIMTNLNFCSNIAYATPYNPQLFPDPAVLGTKYDEFAQAVYKNFSRSLEQVQCNATLPAMYSLARNCDDCAAAYKSWLCSIIMPRCDDLRPSRLMPPSFLNSKNLVFRNINKPFYNGSEPEDLPDFLDSPDDALQKGHTNRSRVDWIDEVVQPGPYRELLPCVDICWSVVRSCPASLQFSCPDYGTSLAAAYADLGVCNNVSQPITIGSAAARSARVPSWGLNALAGLFILAL